MAKILFLSAGNVDGQDRLRVAREERDVRKAIRAANSLAFETVGAGDITAAELVEILTDESPDILHFSGHGNEDELVVEGGVLPAGTLAQLLQLIPDVWCVVLNACYSAELAGRLIDVGVPCVVGMKSAVSDEAATAFSRILYRALARNSDIVAAARIAQTQLLVEFPAQADAPVVYVANAAALRRRSARHAPPALLARMHVASKNKPDIWVDDGDDTHYLRFDVFVGNVPSTTQSVVYRLDKSYDKWAEGPEDGRFRESDDVASGCYISEIDSEDDYSFEAYIRLAKGDVVCLRSWVGEALERYYSSLTDSELSKQRLTRAIVERTITALRNGDLSP